MWLEIWREVKITWLWSWVHVVCPCVVWCHLKLVEKSTSSPGRYVWRAVGESSRALFKSSGNEFCENRSRLYTVKYQIFRKTCIYKILDQSLHKRNIVTKTTSGSPSENHLGAQNIKMFTSIYRENIWLKLAKVALYHWEKFWMFWSKPGSVSGKIRRLIWNTRGHFKNLV